MSVITVMDATFQIVSGYERKYVENELKEFAGIDKGAVK